MMKHITTKWLTTIFAEMNVYSTDTKKTTVIDKDDIITLGYIDNEEYSEITGRVDDVKVEIVRNAVSYGSTNNPVDTIKNDIRVLSIILDCSKQYASNVIELNAREIVEASGSSDVTKVEVTPNIKVAITVVSMNDEGETSEVTLYDIKVGSEIGPFKFKTVDGNIINSNVTVCKFLYDERPEGRVNINAIVVKDENNKVYTVEFKNILSLNEEPPVEEDSGDITPPPEPDGEDGF